MTVERAAGGILRIEGPAEERAFWSPWRGGVVTVLQVRAGLIYWRQVRPEWDGCLRRRADFLLGTFLQEFLQTGIVSPWFWQ